MYATDTAHFSGSCLSVVTEPGHLLHSARVSTGTDTLSSRVQARKADGTRPSLLESTRVSSEMAVNQLVGSADIAIIGRVIHKLLTSSFFAWHGQGPQTFGPVRKNWRPGGGRLTPPSLDKIGGRVAIRL